MSELTLETVEAIVTSALKAARDKKFKPLSIVVYDERGALKALASEDGTSLKRAEIAMGKVFGALSLGPGSTGPATRWRLIARISSPEPMRSAG